MSDEKMKPLNERCFVHERVHPYPSGYVRLIPCTCYVKKEKEVKK